MAEGVPSRVSAASSPQARGVIEVKPPMPGRAAAAPGAGAAGDGVGAGGDGPVLERPALLGPGAWSAGVLWRGVPAGVRGRVVWALRRVRRVRRSKLALAWSAGVGLSGAVIAGLVVATLVRSVPAWWGALDLRDGRMSDLARRVENGAITHITADHQGATRAAVEWPVKLTDEGANAWLNLRLPGWLPRMTAETFADVVDARGELVGREPVDGLRWPESVEEVRVAFVDGRFRVGARVRSGDGSRVYSATLAPEVRADGSLWMRAASVSVGRLTLPAWVVLGRDGGRLRGAMPEGLRATAEAEAVFEKLAGAAPLFEDAVIRLGDGRRVRLLSLEVAEDSLVAWFRTE